MILIFELSEDMGALDVGGRHSIWALYRDSEEEYKFDALWTTRRVIFK